MSNIIYIDTHIHIDIRFIMMKTLVNLRKSSKIVLIRSSFSFLSFLKLRKEEKKGRKKKTKYRVRKWKWES